MVQRKTACLFSAHFMHSYISKTHANIPPYLASDPENSLDNAAAHGDVVTTSANHVVPPGAVAKRTLRVARNEHPGLPQENEHMHSRIFSAPPMFMIIISYHAVC